MFKKLVCLFLILVTLAPTSFALSLHYPENEQVFDPINLEPISFVEALHDMQNSSQTLIRNYPTYKDIHLFHNNKYLSSLRRTDEGFFRFTTKVFQDEASIYRETGFKELPRIHFSNKGDLVYKDQYNTGNYASYNCGPASLFMVFDWLGIEHPKVAQMRKMISDNSRYIYTNEITDYLDEKDVAYATTSLNTKDDIIRLLDQGDILLICFDASKIPYDPNTKINRFYKNVEGHFAVITGYLIINEKVYFEVQDPYSMNREGFDGRPEGDCVFYGGDVMMKSIESWWPYTITFNRAENAADLFSESK